MTACISPRPTERLRSRMISFSPMATRKFLISSCCIKGELNIATFRGLARKAAVDFPGAETHAITRFCGGGKRPTGGGGGFLKTEPRFRHLNCSPLEDAFSLLQRNPLNS